jgi:hypothetical protein
MDKEEGSFGKFSKEVYALKYVPFAAGLWTSYTCIRTMLRFLFPSRFTGLRGSLTLEQTWSEHEMTIHLHLNAEVINKNYLIHCHFADHKSQNDIGLWDDLASNGLMYNKAKANQLLGSFKHYQITARTCAATEGMAGLLQEAMNNGASRPVGGGGPCLSTGPPLILTALRWRFQRALI